MKYDAPRLAQQLAAEYVLGTLHGRARRRFERLLATRADLRAAVHAWERRFAGLHTGFTPQTPRAVVWAAIERAIGAPKTAPLRPPAARGLRFWQTWAALATAASVVLAFGLYREAGRERPVQIVRVEVPVPQPMPYVALLRPERGDAQWLVTLSPERGMLRVSCTGNYPLERGESLQLWMIGEDGRPHSLGMLPMRDDEEMTMPVGDMPMPDKPMLAVSREPAGGSPTGLPTGPVILTTPAQRAS